MRSILCSGSGRFAAELARMLRILGFALCASCAAAMHAPAARPPAVLASRVLAAVRMSSPLPPPPPDSLGLGGSTAGVGGSTAGTAGASPSAKSSEDDAFSMFGDGDDELAIAKESLINELGDGLQALGDNQASRKVDRELIAELLLQLEKLNPTEAPATSPLLNGKWKFLYAGGQTPGMVSLVALLRLAAAAPKSPSGATLLDVGETTLTITRNQPRVEASLKVRVLSLENTIKLFTTLEAKTGSVLVEEYKEVESDLFGIKLPLQAPASFSRSIVVSYLDDDLLIVRSLGGAPDVLVRMDKEWSAPGGSASADDGWESMPSD
ncbi:hypothetical protein KFE25_010592 [Diacronema lutheri]|uniref:Plastid lipid-associated protein/fibrillin conserved domain-containing protein n=1 Tax=Diacronema lutheri TaxID=2081491 RepID=A0A8J6C9B1_DIALT|nr:hypothetical protein KFE25_010592 [Diacronema lutheri]